MSNRTKGAARVRSVENRLHDLGYRTMISSCSGQRRGQRGSSLALDGDLIAIAPESTPWPHLIAEVGGEKKSVKASLLEMTAHPLPGGFVPIVVRLIGRRWRWHDKTGGFDTLDDLLEAQ